MTAYLKKKGGQISDKTKRNLANSCHIYMYIHRAHHMRHVTVFKSDVVNSNLHMKDQKCHSYTNYLHIIAVLVCESAKQVLPLKHACWDKLYDFTYSLCPCRDTFSTKANRRSWISFRAFLYQPPYKTLVVSWILIHAETGRDLGKGGILFIIVKPSHKKQINSSRSRNMATMKHFIFLICIYSFFFGQNMYIFYSS